MMYKLIALCAIFLSLAGCATTPPGGTQLPAGTASPRTTVGVTQAPPAPGAPTLPAKGTVTAPTAAQPVPQTTATTVLTQSSGNLTVQLFSDTDVEVSAAEYVVSGKAPAGTVLSVNDDILVVDASQAFSARVALDEGPNLVEVVASDAVGNEVSFMLTVTYTVP